MTLDAGAVWPNGESGIQYQGLLRKQEILQMADRLIDPTPPADSKQYQPASFDLTVGAIITREKELVYWDSGIREGFIKLRPGEMAIVVTREELNLPLNIAGSTLPIISKSQRGLLVLSHGQIDPGYHGALVVRLLNIRGTDNILRLSERIITATFEQLPAKATLYQKGYRDFKTLLSESGEIVATTAAGVVLEVAGGKLEEMVKEEVLRTLQESRVRRLALYTAAAGVGGLLVKVIELGLPLLQKLLPH